MAEEMPDLLERLSAGIRADVAHLAHEDPSVYARVALQAARLGRDDDAGHALQLLALCEANAAGDHRLAAEAVELMAVSELRAGNLHDGYLLVQIAALRG